MKPLALLGGRTAQQFLDEHWQKKPLLVRGAVPAFEGLLGPDDLAALACRDDLKARLVRERRGRYTLDEGPFDEARFAGLPASRWTLLVQGVDHVLPTAKALLGQFRFVPHARLDDLMVSYAAPGGSVGPHFDSYDVFLLQGLGERRWQISAQSDRTLVEGAPLRILESFSVEEEWVLGPGDMLYLPPRYAHFGVALSPCMTYSIGFRAPTAPELCAQFLAWLPGELVREGLDGMYEDKDLVAPEHPSEIDARMVARVAGMLARVRWDEGHVARFLAQYLSEPKPHVPFAAPARPLSPARFAEAVRARGLSLALPSALLSVGGAFYLNGERLVASARTAPHLLALGDDRHLPAERAAKLVADEPLLLQLHELHRYGWLVAGTPRANT